MSRVFSTTACYLLYSIPLFATHVALAGYADIWMAAFSGLGFVALMRGTTGRQAFQTALGVLMLGLALLVKNEAAVWLLAGLLLYALITFRRRTIMVAGLALLVGALTGLALGISHVDLPFLGTLGVVDDRLEIPLIGSFVLESHNVWQVYWDNFFAMGSWNLLWMLVGASWLIAVIRRKPVNPEFRASALFIAIFLATQFFIFGLTNQGVWADTYTAINRLPLHFLPALLYAALAVISNLQNSGDAHAVERQNA